MQWQGESCILLKGRYSSGEQDYSLGVYDRHFVLDGLQVVEMQLWLPPFASGAGSLNIA